MDIELNERRGRAVFRVLLRAIRSHQHPYERVKDLLPQARVTEEMKKDPRAWALFLFYLTHMMRGRINSDLAARELVGLWVSNRAIFEPVIVSGWSPEALMAVMNQNVQLVPDTEIPRFWIENSFRLTHWGGDPRNIFTRVRSAAELRKRVCNTKRPVRGLDARNEGFVGFQEKMASMLAYFLIDAGLIRPFIISPAVDFHLMRVMVNTGVLVVPDAFKSPRAIAKAGVSVIERFIKRTGVGTIELGDALWVLSRNLCKDAPGEVVKWNDPLRARYQRTCATCPVEQFCRKYVPAGDYYRRGVEGPRIITVTRRTRLKTPQLFSKLPAVKSPAKKTKAVPATAVRSNLQSTLFGEDTS